MKFLYKQFTFCYTPDDVDYESSTYHLSDLSESQMQDLLSWARDNYKEYAFIRTIVDTNFPFVEDFEYNGLDGYTEEHAHIDNFNYIAELTESDQETLTKIKLTKPGLLPLERLIHYLLYEDWP